LKQTIFSLLNYRYLKISTFELNFKYIGEKKGDGFAIALAEKQLQITW
jgi:hypothetical protein